MDVPDSIASLNASGRTPGHAVAGGYISRSKELDAIVTTLLGPEDGADNYMVYTAMGAIMDAAGAAWRIGFGGTCPTQDNVTHGALCDVPYIKEPKHFEVDLRHISPFEWKRTDW